MVDNKAFSIFCQWSTTAYNGKHLGVDYFLKLKKRKDNLNLAYFASDPN